MDLRGKNVLVTGAGRGLGEALARSLAARGARLLLVARTLGEVEMVARSIREQGGVAHALAADVGDKDAIYPLAGAATALLGVFDLVIHNASTLGPTPLALLLDTTCEDFERALAVNVLGPFRLTKVLAGAMALRQHGTIVFVSSDAAVNAYPTWGAYGVSKAAADHLARSLAVELASTGVRVLSIDPGEMDTRMHADAVPEADRATLRRPADVAEKLTQLFAEDAYGTGERLEVAS